MPKMISFDDPAGHVSEPIWLDVEAATGPSSARPDQGQ
ncbi:hypothetical protein QFZ27_001257 [Inquilinus ginsengisoli]